PSAAAILRAAGFPVELGNVPYDFRSTELLAKLDHQWAPNHSFVLRGNYSDTTNENIEPFGGITARSRGAVQLRKDWAIAASQTDILSPRWVNEARFQFAHQKQDINSLDPNCGGPCLTVTQGGPTLEVTGVANVGRQRFTPQPRTNDRYQVTETISFFGGGHSAKAGVDFNYIDYKDQSLPLSFGGRYIFSSLPAIPGLLPAPIRAIQAVALGLPAAYIQGYGNPGTGYGYKDLSLFVQDDWRITRKLTLKPGLRYQRQFWPSFHYDVSNVGGTRLAYDFPQDKNDIAPRLALAWDPKGDGKTSIHAAYGIFYDNNITGIAGITAGIDGRDHVRTLVLTFPASIAAWRAPGHKLPEPTTPYPSFVISIDPALQTPYAHQAALGFDRALGKDISFSANAVYVRGKHQIGSIDYNPTIPAVGPGRRPDDIGGRAGTSASVLQYTSFGETWYRGLTLSLNKRFTQGSQVMVSYTLSKAEDTSTDFQGASVVQDQGLGRNPADPYGLPLGFNALAEKGPATHDQRHRFVLSGVARLPWEFQLHAAGGGGPQRRRKRRRISPGPRPPQSGRPVDERRAKQRDDEGPVHRGRAPEPPLQDRAEVRARGHRGGVQPPRPRELQRDQQHLRAGRVPDRSAERRPGARDLRALRAGPSPAPGSTRPEDEFLGKVSGPDLPRPALLARVLARVAQAGPALLVGPPGAGKTTLLLETARALSARGWTPIYLDLMGAASSPERFAVAALDALPADSFGALLGRATQIRRLAEPGTDGAGAVQAVLSLWAALTDAGGHPVALLLDEPTEIRSLAYFAGLREAATALGSALRRRARGTLLASSYPTLARELWPGLEAVEVSPLTPAEIASALASLNLASHAAAVLRASFGWPRYARVLVERLAAGDGVEAAWAQEMAAGGRLESAARHTHEALLLRSRGYGMSKAVLAAVADEEGMNLTALVARLGRSSVKKRYYYVDGMVRCWVRLHGRGRPATEAELAAAARAAVSGEGAVVPAATAAEAEPVPARRDHLMEID
ncbi:MAG: hypothetical protein DMF82_25720, partial [Acidobacteria bacterium]